MTVADIATEREAVLIEARTWLSTRFHHGQAVKGAGVDCARLVASVYVTCGVVEPFTIGYYGDRWFEHETTERLLDAVRALCWPVDHAEPGDIALFRFGQAAAHAAIVTDWPNIIHADRGADRVREDVIEARGPLERRFVGAWSPRRWHEAPA